MTFLQKHQLDLLEISPAVQNLVKLMAEKPERFKVDLNAVVTNLWWMQDLETKIHGGVYFNKDYMYGSVDFNGYGDFSFINGKEAEAIFNAITDLLKGNNIKQEQVAKERFLDAYQSA